MSEPISTCSAASAASPSPRPGTECELSSSAKSTDAAESSCPERGPESPATTIFGPFTELDLSGSSLGASPVSLPLAPVSSAEARTTAGSGRRLADAWPKSGPLGRCSRILLESETWASPEYSLKWKPSATQCGCLVFRLVPSPRHTGESDIGLWPTVVKQDDGKTPEAHLRMKQNMPGGPRSAITSLTVMAKVQWPTPAARDAKGQTQNPERPDYVPNIVKATGATSSGCLARTEKFVVRLMTLSAWLMGYTAAYLARWETASSRRSRLGSSQP